MAAENLQQSVIFIDLDHTLLEGPFGSVVFPQVLGEISRKTGVEYGTLLEWVRQENIQRQTNPAFSPVQAMDWDDIFFQCARQTGVQLQTNALELVRACPGPPHVILHAGAREALEVLARAKPGRALVLATKGLRKYQLPVLEALELLPFFDEILTPDSSQALKQSLAFYGHWPQVTRVQIMVGDSYEDDIFPAHQFGFKTVWRVQGLLRHSHLCTYESMKDSSGQTVRPDAVVYSLAELPHVVERLEREAFSA